MFKRLFCKLFHGKFHECGVSQAIEYTDIVQVWRCQWWCRKCGRKWTVRSEQLRFSGFEWDYPIPGHFVGPVNKKRGKDNARGK